MTVTKSQTTEQSILEAAESLFLDKGYAKTSTTEIARVAGCNQALVHYYYRSKENLFRQIFEKKVKMFVASLLQVSEENLSFEENLIKRISSHFDMLKANRKFPALLFNEVTTNADLLHKLVEKIGHLPFAVMKQLQEELDAEYEKGCIAKTDARTLLYLIFSINVMAFMSAPLVKLLVNASDEMFEKLLEKRKAGNIRLIMKILKP